ncbi:MAG: hypothetical protein GY953_50060, partial [bacterium]|nr:hypothetical protein [bacterium]
MKHLGAVVVAVLLSGLVAAGQPLPDTDVLTAEGDLAAQMVEGIDRFLDRRLAETSRLRAAVKPDRERLRQIIGAVDERVPYDAPIPVATIERSSLVGEAVAYQIHAIRWPVFDGVDGEGLLLQPRGEIRGKVVALPDADWTPEMLAGIAPGVPAKSQYARWLAENGFLVVIPVLIDRDDTYSGTEGVRFTNQPHREFIFRMAYEMGRHIIGYEVQKVLAVVDWFERSAPETKIGVIGYGEGGLLALYSAALDE